MSKSPTASGSRKRRSWLRGAVVGVVVLVTAMVVYQSRVLERSELLVGHDGVHGDHDKATADVRQYQVGDVFVYALHYEAAVDVAEGGRFYQISVTGGWRLHVIHVDAGEILLAATLEDAQLTSTQARPGQEEVYRRVEAAMMEPAFVKLNTRGAVTGVSMAASMPGSGGDVLRAIIALSQYVESDSAAASWITTESDATGDYIADYRNQGGASVKKSKRVYTELRALGAAGGDVQVLASDGAFVLDDLDRVKAIKVRDVVSSKTDMVPEMTATSMLTLTRTSVFSDLGALSALRDRAARLSSRALYDAPVSDDQEQAIDRAKVAGRTLPDFLNAFSKLPPMGKEAKDQRDVRRRLFVELAALLRLDDTAVDAVLAKILAGDERDPSLLWDALASAGTPKAQAALRTLIDDPRFDDHERRTQMVGLSFVTKSTPETVRFLETKLDDEMQGQQARFGLGTAANHLRGSDDDLAGQATQILLSRLDMATTPSERSDYLRGLGNAAAPEAEDAIISNLNDDYPSVRASAATALRFLPGDDVTATLINVVKTDQDGSVRSSALGALSVRTPSSALLDVVYEAARGDADEGARKQAIATLDRWARSSPEIATALAKFERPDDSGDMR